MQAARLGANEKNAYGADESTMADIASMSVKELRAYIVSAGLKHDDCFEISDLRARAEEARGRHSDGTRVPASAAGAQGHAPPSALLKTERRKFSQFDCTLVAQADVLARSTAPGMVVIVLHGLGSNSDDFVTLPEALKLHESVGRPVLWVFPQAPLGKMGTTAWWTIDVMQWVGAMQSGENAIARLIRDVPPGLPECRSAMVALVEEVCKYAMDTPYSRVVIGGFSQGAMTAIDTALSMPAGSRVAGILSMSGAPIVVEEWATKLATHRGVPVLMTHGTADMTLPFFVSGWLEQLLIHNGASVRKEVHSDGHTLGPAHIVRAVRDFLAERAGAAG